MRSTLIVSAFAALAVAAPRPQDIEWDGVDAADAPVIVTPPVGVIDNAAAVSLQPSASVTSIAVAAVTDTASTNDKRDFLEHLSLGKRDGNCAAQPAGTGPAVHT